MLRMTAMGLFRSKTAYLLTSCFLVAAYSLSNSSPLFASSNSTQSLRITTQSYVIESGASEQPHEIFDRDTGTQIKSSDDLQYTLSLAEAREIDAIKIYGPAPYQLSVKALRGSYWETIDGLDKVDLRNLDAGWHRFDASTPITSDKLQLNLSYKKSNKADGLSEVEIWGKAVNTATLSVLALQNAIQGPNPPDHAQSYAANPQSAELSAGATEQASFTLELNYPPSAIRRAWLAYETKGAGHWVSPERTINGGLVQGGHYRFTSSAWSQQHEPIAPSQLQQGVNTIGYSLPQQRGAYSLRNVHLLVELDNGANFIQQVTASPENEQNPGYRIVDGDDNSAWRPYTSDGPDTPVLTLQFDKPTQPEQLNITLHNALEGDIAIDYLKDGEWKSSPSDKILAKKLQVGSNSQPLHIGVAVEGLRLTFSGGAGSDGEIAELQAIGSGEGASWGAGIHLSYPLNGEYYGDSAYLRGNLQPLDNGSGPATLSAAGIMLTVDQSGNFEALISKQQAGYGDDAEDAPWSIELIATYPDGEQKQYTLQLNQHGDQSKVNGLLGASDNPASAENTGNPYLLEHDEGILDLDGDSMDEPASSLTITTLTEHDLAPLDPGMTNVTKGPRKGYRFGPHGKKFKKKIKVKLPYDKKKLPPGMTEADIRTYYFDEDSGHWRALERVDVDNQKGEVVSHTDHFTDMINATLVLPEHPQAAGFNPTEIKDIKAADPGAGINLIEPPQANNMGDARLSYPIEIPPGRNGMQPQLAISYSSGGGNGWLGLGWDLSVPSISVDTRWGVPRYSTEKESETYLLNGQMLNPHSRHLSLAQLPERVNGEMPFYSRVEGQFSKIIRHGNTPSDYWWEVTDKSGTTHIYGNDGTQGEGVASLGGTQGKYRWMLKKSIDAHGNAVIYDYVVETDKGLAQGTVDGYQIYPSQIRYTDYLGEGSETGKYTVHFTLEGGRSDVIIDGRGGFKQVTAKRLKTIAVRYDNQTVRSYELSYQTGPFIKTLLKSVSQKGKPDTNGAQAVLATHSFDYFDEVSGSGSDYQGFGGGAPWNVGDGGVKTQFLTQAITTSALGGTEGFGGGGSFSIGFEPTASKVLLSANAMAGGGFNTSNGVNALIDINGDGLPDKVYKTSGGFKYRYNTFTPSASGIGVAFKTPDAQALSGLGDISVEESQSFNFGGQAFAGGANIIGDTSISFSTQGTYLSDVNGDGLIDVVDGGSVKFSRLANAQTGEVVFDGTTRYTEYPIGAGVLDTTGMLDEEALADLEKEILANSPLVDAVRRWKAPYSGTIRISGDVHLVDVANDDSFDSKAQEKRKGYGTADGVQVSIEQKGKNDNPLWTVRIPEDDFTGKSLSKVYGEDGNAVEGGLSGVNEITVAKGEIFYFRVQSIEDGAYDIVEWSPTITYLNRFSNRVDVNGLKPYVYNAAEDFVYAGRISPINIQFRGTIRFDGVLQKTAVTTDDVTVAVYHLSKNAYESELTQRRDLTQLHLKHTPVLREHISWDAIGSLTLSGHPGLEVEVDDKLVIVVEIDSPIDLAALKWEAGEVAPGRANKDIGPFKLYYTEAYRSEVTPYETDDEGNMVGDGGLPTDIDGNPSGWLAGSQIDTLDPDGNYTIQIDASHEINFYPHSTLPQAQDSWSVPEMGMLLVTPIVEPKLKFMGFDDDGQKIFSDVFHYDTEVVFTTKKQGELIDKKVMHLSQDSAFNPYAHSFAIPATKDEAFYFDFSTRDPVIDSNSGLPPTLKGTDVKVHFIRPETVKDLNNVPLNNNSQAASIGKSMNTATILPLLSLKQSDEPLRGTVMLHVEKTVLDENDESVTSILVSRKIVLDSEVPFNPYAYAFDVQMSDVEQLNFRYVVNDAALAAQLDRRTVRVIYSRNHSRDAVEYGDLSLFETDTAIAETLASESTYSGMAMRPIGGAGIMAAAPMIRQNGNEVIGLDGELVLSVWRKFVLRDASGVPVVDEQGVSQYVAEKLRDYPISLHQGDAYDSGLNTFDVTPQPGDQLIYRYHTDDSALLGQGLEFALWTQFRHYGGGAVPPGWNPAQALHSYGYWGVFPNAYRGWADVGYNGQGEFAEMPIQPERFVMSGNEDDYTFDKADAREKADSQSMQDQTVFPAAPQLGRERWFGGDDGLWFSAGRISSSRMITDYVDFLEAADLNQAVSSDVLRGAGAAAVPRMSMVNSQITAGAGYYINISATNTPSESLLDYLDLNGDRFPDVVGGGTIQYTEMNGALGGTSGSYNGSKVRESLSVANTISGGGTVAKAIANARALFNPSGGHAESTNVNANFGISGSLGSRTNDVEEEFRDINGDGLPDRVSLSNGTLTVALNIGYGFLPGEIWESVGGVLDSSKSSSYNMGVSYNNGAKEYAGSVSVTTTGGQTLKTLADINGDGLPDIIAQDGVNLKVRLNLGNGFVSDDKAITWKSEGMSLLLGLNESFSLNGGASATAHIGPLCLVTCFIPMNPGANFSDSVARPESQLKDVNGDGYPDYVYSTSPESMSVAENKRGKTNLLKQITRPLGAVITLDYSRTGNTYEQPQNVWALSRVSVDDGVDDDGGDQLTTFLYDNGFHDRGEREFYGFSSVITEQRDSTGEIYRSVTRLFHNDSFYTKGLLESEVLEAGATNAPSFEPYRKTENRYRYVSVPDNIKLNDEALKSETLSIAPLLESTTKSFYEGSEGISKSTTSSFSYDGYGNVIQLSDSGDSDDTDAADDLSATIKYSAESTSCLDRYIVGNATIIQVFDANNKLKRNREGTIDCVAGYSANNGKVSVLKQFLKKGNTSHTLGYDKYGNLASLVGQQADTGGEGDQRIQVSITYEDILNTYPETVTDHFGLSVSSTYDYAFGKQLSRLDTNGNTISYTYDAFGRMAMVTGPYQQDGGPYTIEFDYHPQARPAYALTHHYDRFRDASGQDTIDTALFTDGLKRVLQTQKDAGLYDGGEVRDGLIISGRVKLDGLGRQVEKYYTTSQPGGSIKTAATFQPLFKRESGEANSVIEYDVLDRTRLTTLADGSVTEMHYGLEQQPTSSGGVGGGLRFVTTVTDAELNQRKSYKDVRELITTVREYLKDEEGKVQSLDTHYVYDELKQITDVYDAKNHHTSVDYDLLGRRIAINNPDTGLVEYQYNLNGDLRYKITPNLRKNKPLQKIEYRYDHDRLVNILYPNAPANDSQNGTPPDPINVTYTYGDNTPENATAGRVGRIIRVDHQSGYEERWYGKLGETIQERKWVQVPGDLWHSGQKHNQGTTQPEEYEVFTTQYLYDTFGRMQSMVFPDGERLTYSYNAGGLPQSAEGSFKGTPYRYVELVGYDEYEQRVRVEMGNGAVTDYSYEPELRRLDTLKTESQGYRFQNLDYTYDKVGNITGLLNDVTPTGEGMGGYVKQGFGYDGLYRLTDASGTYMGSPDSSEEYSLSMEYDTIHNIKRKNQKHWVNSADGNGGTKHATTYDWSYEYTGAQPHAPTHIGERDPVSLDILGRTFSYDANGNQAGWTNDKNATQRAIEWDDENRIQSIDDKGSYSQYSYDDAGQRVIKQSRQNLTIYVNQYFTERNGSVGTKNIYIGSGRVLSKVTGGTLFIRSYDGITGAKTPPGQAKQPSDKGNNGKGGDKSNNGKALGKAKNASKGKGKDTTKTNGKSAQANNTTQSNASSGKTHGVNGLEHRSERANEVAQNTCKNKHLREIYCDDNGNGIPDSQEGADGASGTSGEQSFMEEIVEIGSNGSQLFYYHSDHLGSTGYVTRENGQVHEHIQYFPFGETWVQQGGNTEKDPYLYTGKELDEETGLYYFGARYYDPRTSVWASVDPIINKYLPSGGSQDNGALSTGGVYNALNLSPYVYSGLNPIVFYDPDGNVTKGIGRITSAVLKAAQQDVRIVNKKLAGSSHPTTGVPFNKDGFPDFSQWSEKNVTITQAGNRTSDFRDANEKAGLIDTPDGYTWHHHEDGKTMQLIPTDIHDKTAHTGGVAVVKKAAAIAGTLASGIAEASAEDWASFGIDMITPLGLESDNLGEGSDVVQSQPNWGSGTPYKDMQEYSTYLRKRNEAESW